MKESLVEAGFNVITAQLHVTQFHQQFSLLLHKEAIKSRAISLLTHVTHKAFHVYFQMQLEIQFFRNLIYFPAEHKHWAGQD